MINIPAITFLPLSFNGESRQQIVKESSLTGVQELCPPLKF